MKIYSRDLIGPLIAIDFPLDKNGNGPASDADIVKSSFEVWNGTYATVCECADLESAQIIAEALTEWKEKRGYTFSTPSEI